MFKNGKKKTWGVFDIAAQGTLYKQYMYTAGTGGYKVQGTVNIPLYKEQSIRNSVSGNWSPVLLLSLSLFLLPLIR